MARYEIRQIRQGHEGIDAMGAVVADADEYETAKGMARAHAHDTSGGVAIVDTLDEMIDWGHCVTDYEGRESADAREYAALGPSDRVVRID